MAVAKRQGRSRRVQGPGVRCHCLLLKKQHSCLNPIRIGQAPNLCCDETKNWGTYTRVTSMVPWLGCNQAETTSQRKRPSTAGVQLSEAPAMEAEGEETQQGEGPSCWIPGQRKTNSAERSRGPVSDPRRPPIKVRGPHWRDMPNEILIPLQSLLSCCLEPPANRRVAGGTTEGLWRGYSSACPKGAVCRAPAAVTQAGGGSSVLSLLCAKDQTNEIVSTGQIFSKFSGGPWRGFLGTFSPLLFPPVLQRSPGTWARPKPRMALGT